jgi:LysM repeat protein/ABC-type branched-subunit amino acid transport system substrate-binding protein
MKRIILLWTLILNLLFITNAQQNSVKRSNNKVNLNGSTYYIHIVNKNETLYAISKAYNIPIDTIKKDNPYLSDTLKINQYIKVRIDDKEDSHNGFVIYHNVKKGDTPYNISITYGISIDDLYKYNPDARLGIKTGEILRIPKKNKNTKKEDIVVSKDTAHMNSSFIIHKVNKKETLFGISVKYDVSKEDIKALNKELETRPLQVGESLRIPISSSELTYSDSNVYYYKVKKQETVYGICKMFNIKEKELYKLNDGLKKRELQQGELLRIPKNELSDSVFKEVPEDIYIEDKQDLEYKYFSKEDSLHKCPQGNIDKINKYKVAFFLPFFLNINDTLGKYIDEIVTDEDGVETVVTKLRTGKIEDKIYPQSKIFIEFYQGALLALQNLKEQGVSFDVHIYDTQNDTNHVKELLINKDFSNYDLFIGPVFGDILQIVGKYAYENKINIVSPLSIKNSFIENNPYAFQVSPPLEVQMQHASDFLNDFDIKNYIVIHDGNNLDQQYISHFKQQLFAQMNEDNYNQIRYNEVFYYDARDSVLKTVFSPNMQNIVIIPSSSQAFVTDVLGKLNGYSFEFDITIFGQPRWLRFENIELSNFHNTNTHIFSNSYIDYTNRDVIEFVKKYRYVFNNEPNKFAFQGYDITKYFCLTLNKYGHDFKNCLYLNKIDLLQTNFHFVPYSNTGGYQNTAIYLLEYTRDYTLRKVAQYP